MSPVLALLDEDGGSDNGWVWLAVLAVVGLLIVLSVVAHMRKRDRIEAWLGSLGFREQALLPTSLKPTQSVWQAAPKTRRIFTGNYAGFGCAVFEIDQGKGETQSWVSSLAVERSPCGPMLTSAAEELGATLDQISTPGWLLATVPNASAEQPVLEPILRLMTLESWPNLAEADGLAKLIDA